MKIGYAIVENEQSKYIVEKMENAAVDKIIFQMSLSQKDDKDIIDVINDLNENDILVINSLDTLGDTIIDIIEVISLLDNRNIGIQLLDIPFSDNESNQIIQPVLKKYLIYILNWFSNKSKNEIRKRQSLGINRLKEKRKQGRPKKYSDDAENPEDREVYHHVINMLNDSIPIATIANSLDLSRNTIYRIRDELLKKNDYT